MESIHGVDVSWMSKHGGNAKDTRPTFVSGPEKSRSIHDVHAADAYHAAAKPIPRRPSYVRSVAPQKPTTTLNHNQPKPASPSPPHSRRTSWLSSISSKFSISTGTHSNPPPATASPQTSPRIPEEPPVPTGPQSPKNAILPHAVKPVGDGPYTPAPPKLAHPNFLQSALRRLSSSNGQLPSPGKASHNGLCERRVLNVDKNRERCHISELDQKKLRRVAFCVDVEVASGPKYLDEKAGDAKGKDDLKDKKAALEKGEAKAPESAEAAKDEKGSDGAVATAGEGTAMTPAAVESTSVEPAPADVKDGVPAPDKTKKREKKKRTEEERKARKEKKRKLAEANGTIPVELVRSSSNGSATLSPTGPGYPRTQGMPTTDPVRIYRRCCQLRETPILRRITEQLADTAGRSCTPGMVAKLDLTGYWLQLPDIIALGDYLAVVPVKELIMENCGLTDEGVRVILAGLLAAKYPDWERKRHKKGKWGEVPQGGYVERIVFKNNAKIGRDGWRYISTFIAMCRSLKSMDLSKVPFPKQISRAGTAASAISTSTSDISCVFGKAIGERLAGCELELLNLAECGMTTEQLGRVVDGMIKSGLRCLGLAGNNITPEGVQHVARFIRNGRCEGLDLGGNDLKDQLEVIATALDETKGGSGLYALSLADCKLTSDSLWRLFPALAKLTNFRFIDLSQNHRLFDSEPSALSLLRRYLPRLPALKRIHLTDVSMTSEQAIALAEILPESPNLAHVNLVENPGLAALANAEGEANQEEACALYASLMAAVRVSKTIICVDIEIPSAESSEIVKALAKQVVAYCLRNLERGPFPEISEAAATISEPHGGEKEVTIPDVLLHLVGHVEDEHEHEHGEVEPAPDDDYVIGGTGVVKALGICLRNRGNDYRRASALSLKDGPRTAATGRKAKDMSKNLLASARQIRARLHPALVKESRSAQSISYMRLQFLDQTLEGMIKRFEDEYPETRLPEPTCSPDLAESQPSPTSSVEHATAGDESSALPDASAQSDDEEVAIRPLLSHKSSSVSLIARRALAEEEGRVHRFGQQFRRDILKPEAAGGHGLGLGLSATGTEEPPRHLQHLCGLMEGIAGEELKHQILSMGDEVVMADRC